MRLLSPSWPNHGFTLIEALITVALLAILLGLAAPSMRNVQMRWEVLRAAHLLESSMGLARSEAIRRAGKVVVRRLSGDCVTGLAVNRWDCGWVIFHDMDANGIQDSGEPTLQSVELPGRVQVLHSNADGAAVQLNRYGGIHTGGEQSFDMQPAQAPSAVGQRLLCMAQSGRMRLLEGHVCT